SFSRRHNGKKAFPPTFYLRRASECALAGPASSPYGPVVQRSELPAHNGVIAGSNPAWPTKKHGTSRFVLFFLPFGGNCLFAVQFLAHLFAYLLAAAVIHLGIDRQRCAGLGEIGRASCRERAGERGVRGGG